MLNKISRRDGGHKMYCGPAALCAITGKHYEDVRTVVNRVRGRKHNQGITGMGNREMIKALNKMSYIALVTKVQDNPTLSKFLRERDDELKKQTLLIEVTGHYVTVKGDTLIDNFTVCPVHIAIAPHKRTRVKKYWVIK